MVSPGRNLNANTVVPDPVMKFADQISGILGGIWPDEKAPHLQMTRGWLGSKARR